MLKATTKRLMAVVFVFCLALVSILPASAAPRSMTSANNTALSAPTCTASVIITTAKKLASGHIKISATWVTTGASSARVQLEIFKYSTGALVTSYPFSQVSPNSNAAWIIPPTQLQGLGLYKARVTLNTNCGASSQYETFFVV